MLELKPQAPLMNYNILPSQKKFTFKVLDWILQYLDPI